MTERDVVGVIGKCDCTEQFSGRNRFCMPPDFLYDRSFKSIGGKSPFER